MRRPFWAAATDLLVIVDDVAIPIGTFRLRAQGSAGGHNGLKSIEAAVGNRNYPRLRIGIRPDSDADDETAGEALTDFVLSAFRKTERETIDALMPRLTEVVEEWITNGIERAMNAFNPRP